ncbi:MAG: hypothetical protein EPO28_12695 [Saprospiraceae bacterium]|nr:MAG: hypothetical protein EPO28_12695 [Saprospiraceae bacterium]
MMKQLLLLLALVFTASLAPAQELQTAPAGKFSSLTQKISVTATAGTGYYRSSLSSLGKLSLGELNIQYKASPLFSFGIGTMGAIQNDRSYFDSEGVLVSACDDGNDEGIEDGNDEGIEDDGSDDPNDTDNIEEENQDGDQNGCDCEGEFGFGDNLMGNFTFHLPGKFPFFFQAATGYSFNSQDPFYSVMAGYHQKLFAGFGILAGIRYSDIVSSKNYVSKTGGIKAELGLGWNF